MLLLSPSDNQSLITCYLALFIDETKIAITRDMLKKYLIKFKKIHLKELRKSHNNPKLEIVITTEKTNMKKMSKDFRKTFDNNQRSFTQLKTNLLEMCKNLKEQYVLNKRLNLVQEVLASISSRYHEEDSGNPIMTKDNIEDHVFSLSIELELYGLFKYPFIYNNKKFKPSENIIYLNNQKK